MIQDEIYKLLSAGRTPTKKDFHAGKMFMLLNDPFGLWCSYHAPKNAAVEEPNLYETMRTRVDRGNRDGWIQRRCETTVVIRGETDEEKFKNTLQAMADGVDGIIGAVLWDLRGKQGLWGSVNLLFKINDGVSLFGDYHYQIVQLKRAADVKEHYQMQTAIMDHLLTNVQSAQAQYATFVLRANREQDVDIERLHERALAHVNTWAQIKNGKLVPEAQKPPKAAGSPWRVFANKYVFEHKELILLPHLNAHQRAALRANGIKNYEGVLKAGLPKIKEIFADPVASEAQAIETYATSLAFKEHKPVIRNRAHWPITPQRRNLYFDFEATETFTKDSVSFVYLIGIWDKEADKFVSFVAKSEAEEALIFKQFADYIGDGQGVALYHWTEYEVRKMFSLVAKYPHLKDDLHKLMDACVDLKIVVEKSFYLPSPSLSLKAAAPAFGFAWRQTDCGAMDSMVYYTKWLAGGGDNYINKVLMYNEDDCRAMLFIEDYLNEHEALTLSVE